MRLLVLNAAFNCFWAAITRSLVNDVGFLIISSAALVKLTQLTPDLSLSA